MPRHLLTLLLLLCSTFVLAAEPLHYVPGEILVKYRDGTNIEPVHAAAKATRLEQMPLQRWQRLRLPAALNVEQALEHYRQQPEVEYAEPNYIAYKAETSPDDTEFSRQWDKTNMRLPLAWDLNQGSRNIVIAVVDTGIFYDHPDLTTNMWTNPGETSGDGLDNDGNGIIDDIYGVNYNGTTISGKPKDDDTADWHGTHVAGIAGAQGNNGTGIAGTNWQTSLMGVKVLHGPSGSGTTADIIKGIDYAIANGANVINLSLTIYGYSTSLADALQRADNAGILTVSAAGNAGTNNDLLPYSPASIRTPNNIAVAALTQQDSRASYSNYGQLSVDLAAPGGICNTKVNNICVDSNAIYSTIGTLGTDYNQYRYLSGTSMATPQVSGLAALIWAEAPTLTHHQVKARILNGVRPLGVLNDITITGGTADAYTSLTTTEKPAVFRVVPSSAYAGDTLTITGINFGSATGTVNVGTLELPSPSIWSDSSIQVTVPQEMPSSYERLQINNEGNGFFVRRYNRAPTVTLTADPASGSTPLTTTLAATATDSDGTIVSYEWDLGDGIFITVDDGTAATVQHTFNSAGDFTLRVRVTDNSGGSTIATTVLSVSGSGDTSSSSDSRCFIATAAYGSPMESEVMALRQFRDRYLLTNAIGSAFVETYYAISPSVADAIRESGWAREVVRTLLRPLVTMAGWLINDAEAGSSRPLSLQEPKPDVVANEYLVGFVSGTSEAAARVIVEQEGGTLREFYVQSDYGLAIFTDDHPADEVGRRLQAHSEVRYVEPNRVVHKPEQP